MSHKSLFESITKLLPFLPKQVVFIPSSLLLLVIHLSCGLFVSMCNCSFINKGTNHTSDTQITSQCFSSIFCSWANTLNRQLCQFLKNLLLFHDIFSQHHKRQAINPPFIQCNANLTVWQAIMYYHELSILRTIKLDNKNKHWDINIFNTSIWYKWSITKKQKK